MYLSHTTVTPFNVFGLTGHNLLDLSAHYSERRFLKVSSETNIALKLYDEQK